MDRSPKDYSMEEYGERLDLIKASVKRLDSIIKEAKIARRLVMSFTQKPPDAPVGVMDLTSVESIVRSWQGDTVSAETVRAEA